MDNQKFDTEEFKGSRMGLFDNNHPDQKSITAEKVIDITPVCPSSAQAVIKYANITRGQIAQICDLYKKGQDLGREIHYHLDAFTPESLATEGGFERTASLLGIKPIELAKIIYSNKI